MGIEPTTGTLERTTLPLSYTRQCFTLRLCHAIGTHAIDGELWPLRRRF